MQDNTSPSNPYDNTPKDNSAAPEENSPTLDADNKPTEPSGWSPVSSDEGWSTATPSNASTASESPTAPHQQYQDYGQNQPHASYMPPTAGYQQYAPPVGPPVDQSSPYGYPAYGQHPAPYGQPYGVAPAQQAERDEEISKWVGVGGLTSWIWAWFIGMPFLIPIGAGIVGLVFAYRARSAGRRAQAGFVMGWINAVGAVVLGILLVILFFAFVAYASANNIH